MAATEDEVAVVREAGVLVPDVAKASIFGQPIHEADGDVRRAIQPARQRPELAYHRGSIRGAGVDESDAHAAMQIQVVVHRRQGSSSRMAGSIAAAPGPPIPADRAVIFAGASYTPRAPDGWRRHPRGGLQRT